MTIRSKGKNEILMLSSVVLSYPAADQLGTNIFFFSSQYTCRITRHEDGDIRKNSKEEIWNDFDESLPQQ